MKEGFYHPQQKSPLISENTHSAPHINELIHQEEKEVGGAQRKAVDVFCSQLALLSLKDGIPYTLEDNKEGVLLTADKEQFSPFLTHVHTLLHDVNEYLSEHQNTFHLRVYIKGMHTILLKTETVTN